MIYEFFNFKTPANKLINDTTKKKAQRPLVGQYCTNTNTLITEYLNQQANVVIQNHWGEYFIL